MPDQHIGPCPWCGQRTTCADAMLGDPAWRVYCQACDLTVRLPQERYPTRDEVRAFWAARTGQGELFAQDTREHPLGTRTMATT